MTYNEAVEYLKNKWGIKYGSYKVPDISHPDYHIHLLLTQYYYGIAAKHELHCLTLNKYLTC